ncbi:MAG TPA: mannose-1-phosphate guanyltransferase [Alphaproteobacteria bacterium]|nr:mannose-1-phosphate guanyltransferase [Alphaproteobacteria bacterium]
MFSSLRRILAVFLKELIQMRRDRMTIGMILAIPIMQLVMFGYAINGDPRNLPTVLRVHEHSVFSRSLITALENTRYFRIVASTTSEARASTMLANGEAAFVLTVPAGFSRAILRGERPSVLLEADASDPAASANAVSALQQLPASVFQQDLKDAGITLPPSAPPFDIVVQRRYNPEGVTALNIVPGLIGVILTMTMTLVTSMAVVKEFERGTMENLLAMPAKPHEVMFGKILPYVLLGYAQVVIIFAAARFLFDVPMAGSYSGLLLIVGIFIAANLSVGFTLSTLATNQAQAMQMTMFFFLPSILLSGFMFPFRGMPNWAQWIGEVLPITHFLRLVRAIMLKGTPIAEMADELWALLAFTAVMWVVAMLRYRRTLD